MPTLFFPERDILRLALASGGVAASVTRAPATAGFDEQGRLWLTTSAWLPKETLIALMKFGAQIVGSSRVSASESISNWLQLIPLEPVPLTAEMFAGPVLFELPGTRLASLAGEIERLGRSPCAFCWRHGLDDETGNDRVLLKSSAPPYFSVLRVLDRNDGAVAFVEQAPRVWIAAGYRHPLADRIQPRDGETLFLHPPRTWEWREDGAFAPIAFAPYEQQAVASPSTVAANSESPIPIPLKLLPDDNDAPAELWLVRDDAFSWLDRFIRSADQDMVKHYSLAMTVSQGQPVAVLRLRSVKESPPILIGLPLGYRPLLKLANLFIPCSRRIAPVPRRDTLRKLLAPDTHRLTWLRPLEDGKFQTESVPLAAFHPLKDWVEYRIDEARRCGETWRQGAFLTFEHFQIGQEANAELKAEEVTVSTKPTPLAVRETEHSAPAEPTKRGWLARIFNKLAGSGDKKEDELPLALGEAPPVPEDPALAAQRLPQERSLTPPAKFNTAIERTKTLKKRFLDVLARLTPKDRLELWPELATAFAQSNNAAESAVCWLNALWEQVDLSPTWAWNWLRAEAAGARWNPQKIDLHEWLAAPTNQVQAKGRARAIAAYVVWAVRQQPHPPDFLTNLNELHRYLDHHEELLPVRAVWLARSALLRMTRGDVLSLARTRDRLFERLLREGLSLDLDAPAFVRFAESDDADRLDAVGGWLVEKRKPIAEWIAHLGPAKSDGEVDRVALEPFGLQAEVRCTCAYADLMLAWGLARLAEKNESARLRDEAWRNLDDADPIHSFLKTAFDFRIGQAREGKRAGGSLPPELLACLERMPADDRYHVDRFRQHSKILDPTERINAFWASTFRHYRHWDKVRKQLIDLPGLESAALNERVRRLLATAADALPAILLDVLDLAPRLDRDLAEKALEEVPRGLDLLAGTPTMQLSLLDKGLKTAESFDRPTIVQPLAERFIQYVEKQRGLPASTMLEGLTSQTFRCFRRLGMKNEAYDVLGRVHYLLTAGEEIPAARKRRAKDWPNLMRTLLPVAAAYYYAGQEELGFKILDPISEDLYRYPMSLAERTALAFTYAATLGHVPVRIARGRFGDLFQFLKKITINGWNTHYTLQPLKLIDTAILAIVSEDFMIGPKVRGWLDDEEFLVRQRIHKELKELMAEEGV